MLSIFGIFRDRLGNGRRLEEIGIRPYAVRALLDLFEQRGRENHYHRLWACTLLDSDARPPHARGQA